MEPFVYVPVALCLSNMLQYRIEDKVFNLKLKKKKNCGYISGCHSLGQAAGGGIYQLSKINRKNTKFPA